MSIRSYDDVPRINEPIFRNNIIPYDTISIFHGKKKKTVLDLLAGLELVGPATTAELAKFLISEQYTRGEVSDMRKNAFKERGHQYWNHLYGYAKKKTGRKKTGKYSGLINEEYVKIVDTKKSSKNNDIDVFFPTLKGHLVGLGYDFTNNELIQFLNTASKNSLYFAYMYDLCHKISIDFVKEIFLKPIKEMIKQKRIRFDDDFRLNFDMIATASALKIRKEIEKSWIEIHSYYNRKNDHSIKANNKLLQEIDQMIKNTWFDLRADSKWITQLVELYYPTKEQQAFYDRHYDFADGILIYKVMREIHSNYYHSYEEPIPIKYKQKFPIPIRRNRKQQK